ncbi:MULTISPECIES: hypothetical protein [unclassified Variovorax]|uniref:hypothetical protein n=1 Tax=unclassified Variovorax TaxID=663243 RepID=UPI003F48B77C
MSTEQEAWHRNRILWRAKQHKWDSLTGCSYFNPAAESEKHILELHALQGEPLLLAWGDQANWSVITTKEVLSKSQDTANRLLLADVSHTVIISSSASKNPSKEEMDILLVGIDHKRIWTTPGPMLFALASILKMFPFATPVNPI